MESRLNGLLLDVKDGNRKVNASVQTFLNNGTGAQRWRLTLDGCFESALKTDDGQDLVLEVTDISMSGGRLRLNTRTDSVAQKWTLNSRGMLVSAVNGFVIGIVDARNASEAPVQLFPPNDTSAQAWNFRAYSSGTYILLTHMMFLFLSMFLP